MRENLIIFHYALWIKIIFIHSSQTTTDTSEQTAERKLKEQSTLSHSVLQSCCLQSTGAGNLLCPGRCPQAGPQLSQRPLALPSMRFTFVPLQPEEQHLWRGGEPGSALPEHRQATCT